MVKTVPLRFVMFLLAAFVALAIPFTTSADFEIVPSLAAEHAGATVIEDVSFDGSEMSVVDGANLTGVSDEWNVQFLQPFVESVPSDRAAYILARVQQFDNFRVETPYALTHAPIPGTDENDTTIESQTVSFDLAMLGAPGTPSGLYYLAVYSYPETKNVCQDVEPFDCSDEPYTEQDFLDWFYWQYQVDYATFVGDVPTTYSPAGSRSLTFEYVAGDAPGGCEADCFSNVLFIPGIKATELYEGSSKRWLPGLFNFDGQHLAMNESGESVNDITVGDPIRNAYTFFEVYDEFFDFLDNLKSINNITDWQSAPYDWRYDVYDAASQNQNMHDGSTQNLVDQIYELAATSKTGKVTIIAHSNGGLVGKALIDALGDDADFVDRFIMVGTPQLGTPSAIAAMLHGTEQGLPVDSAPFAMSKATSRELSENMPGAYGLLPLAEYFSIVSDPLVEFGDSSYTTAYRNAYGDSINSASELYSFLLGTGDGRAEPDSDDTLTPSILNSTLLSDALTTRNSLESWTPPAGIEVIQIAGWGLDTLRGFRYAERGCSFFEPCGTLLDIEPLITAEGDQTVVSPSASAMSEETYYFNMASFNRGNDTSWTHANMLAATSVQDLLQDIIKNEPRDASYIVTTKPTAADAGKRLHLSVHSPVTIGIRDSQGRFTGVMPNPNPSSDIPVVVQEIPNTYYFEFGEGKYVGFMANEQYDIVMQGTGNGSFTLEVEEVENNQVTGSATYSDVPVTTETVAELNIQDLENKGGLEVDENGDGTVDETIEPDGTQLSLTDLITLIKENILALTIKDKLKQSLLKKIDSLEKKIEGKKQKNAKILTNFKQKISKQEVKGRIAAADANEIVALLELLEAQSDTTVLDADVLTALKAKIQSLTIKAGLKKDLLKRVERLENKRTLTNSLENLTKSISKKAADGKIPDADAQMLIDLLGRIESVL